MYNCSSNRFTAAARRKVVRGMSQRTPTDSDAGEDNNEVVVPVVDESAAPAPAADDDTGSVYSYDGDGNKVVRIHGRACS